MNLSQLRALVAVAESKSFSAAAGALHTVQSNISSHIAHLELELGVTLVERRTGKLTGEGEVVAARVHRIEAELEAIQCDLAFLRREVTGTARLGMIATTARWLAPPLLAELNNRICPVDFARGIFAGRAPQTVQSPGRSSAGTRAFAVVETGVDPVTSRFSGAITGISGHPGPPAPE